LAEETKIIVRKGAWQGSYKGDNNLSRGTMLSYLEDNPEVVQDVQQVRQKLEWSSCLANSVMAVS